MAATPTPPPSQHGSGNERLRLRQVQQRPGRVVGVSSNDARTYHVSPPVLTFREEAGAILFFWPVHKKMPTIVLIPGRQHDNNVDQMSPRVGSQFFFVLL